MFLTNHGRNHLPTEMRINTIVLWPSDLYGLKRLSQEEALESQSPLATVYSRAKYTRLATSLHVVGLDLTCTSSLR